MPTFIELVEPPRIHYHIKQHQNQVDSFQVASNFVIL